MAFGYPGDELQMGLVDSSFFSQFAEGAKGLPSYGLGGPIKSVRAATEKYGSHIFSDIVSEYQALFGSGPNSRCPPYELSYLTGPLFMNTGQLADIAGFYKAFGLEAAEGKKDRPDHISTELEFMHFLALKELFALRSGKPKEQEICRDAQRKFLRDHLGRWTNVFSRRIEREGNSDFYYELSRLLDGFVGSDSKMLGVKVEKIKQDQFESDEAQEDSSCGAGLGPVNNTSAKKGGS